MFWIILGIIAIIGFSIYYCIDNSWAGFDDCAFIVFVISLFGSMTTILLVLISSGIMSGNVEFEYTKIEETNIIALKDNIGMEGHFYITGGYVGSELYYYYATETEFGYKTEKVKAELVYIKETNETPRIERYKGDFANSRNELWGIPLCNDRYIIYCPEGTVCESFLIDLE